MTRNDVRHGIDEAARPRRLWRGFLVLAALSLVAEFAVHLHPHFDFEAVFGFAAWLGLAAGIAIVAVAGALARLLGRPDTYYRGDA